MEIFHERVGSIVVEKLHDDAHVKEGGARVTISKNCKPSWKAAPSHRVIL